MAHATIEAALFSPRPPGHNQKLAHKLLAALPNSTHKLHLYDQCTSITSSIVNHLDDIFEIPLCTQSKCMVIGCNKDTFIIGRCLQHCVIHSHTDYLLSSCTRIRSIYNLFSHIRSDQRGNIIHHWCVPSKNMLHSVELVHDNHSHQLSIRINDQLVYQHIHSLTQWIYTPAMDQLTVPDDSITLGVRITPGNNKCKYELLVDNILYNDALNRLVDSYVYKCNTFDLQYNQPIDGQYIHKYWTHSINTVSSKYGLAQTQVAWNFTISGHKHVIQLYRSHVSQRSKLLIDRSHTIKYQPNMFQYVRNTAVEYEFNISNVPCRVKVTKLRKSTSLKHKSSTLIDSHNYEYMLYIGNVPHNYVMRYATRGWNNLSELHVASITQTIHVMSD